MLRKIICFVLCGFVGFGLDNYVVNQQPLIVEFAVFKEAQRQCEGGDYTKLPCLVNILKNYSNKIYTKYSGSNAQISVIFYAINNNGEITFPLNIKDKYCEFSDTFGRKSLSKLTGNGFHYILNYNLPFSSSHSNAYISCAFKQNDKIISQISEPISVIPKDFDINVSILSNQDSSFPLQINNQSINSQNPSSPNYSNTQSVGYDSVDLTLKAQTYPLNINANAVARNIYGNIDEGFSGSIVPLSIKFIRDNGLCSPIGESINGSFDFKNGRYRGNVVNINFLDVASGELEITLGHTLDAIDRNSGKCLLNENSANDISNVGKIPCQKYIVIKKRVDILPYSFFATLNNRGRQIYYNQHSYIPAIKFLPSANIELQAINDRNQSLKNFTSNCYGKDLVVKIDDFKNDFVFISENMEDNIISKETFSGNSKSSVVRKISANGIKDRSLTPADLFNSSVIDLSASSLIVGFYNKNEKYPQYQIHPRVSGDWRVALMRGRISLVKNTNESTTLVANPKIYYEIFCKAPTCKVIDLESTISPNTRFAKSPLTNHWFVNSAHPYDLKVQSENLSLSDGVSVYSLGNVVNGVQVLALHSNTKGIFEVKINQGDNINDFAKFLYFAPNFVNIKENLGVSSKIEFK